MAGCERRTVLFARHARRHIPIWRLRAAQAALDRRIDGDDQVAARTIFRGGQKLPERWTRVPGRAQTPVGRGKRWLHRAGRKSNYVADAQQSICIYRISFSTNTSAPARAAGGARTQSGAHNAYHSSRSANRFCVEADWLTGFCSEPCPGSDRWYISDFRRVPPR